MSERREEPVRSGGFVPVTSRRPADRSLDTLRLLETEQALATFGLSELLIGCVTTISGGG